MSLQSWIEAARRALARSRKPTPGALAAPLALAGLIAAATATPLRAEVFDPVSFTLDNGLQVVVVSNHRAPIVQHMVWYKAGAADERPGESGVAHFLEHLMFKGTDSLEPGEFSRIVARNGGRENAFTSWDYTAYFQKVARDRLETVMRHEADRMANLRLTDEVVLPERDVVLEERRARVDNEPSAQLSEMTRARLFINHPYGTPIIGWQHEIAALDTETALRFYEDWYAPNNAVLIVAGDVEPEDVRQLAEKHYGPVPARPVPERLRPAEPPHSASARVTLRSPRVGHPELSVTYLAPSLRTAEGNEAYALRVLAHLLGGGPTSRLYRALVVEQGVASSAGARYWDDAYDQGTFTLYVSPRNGSPLEPAEAALRAEIARLLEDGVTAEEVEAAKERLRAEAVYARDSLGTAPYVIGTALATGGTIEDVESWPERIGAVTPEQVEAAARAALVEPQSVTSVLLPEPSS